jgi:SAM-dependent methyltransferase
MYNNLVVSILKGLLTYLPGYNLYYKKIKSKSNHSCSNARFCYSLWLRNLVFLHKNRCSTSFDQFAEVGNGGSLGIAICALLTGTRKYFALEIEDNFDIDSNIRLLDEIFKLFQEKTPIPDHYEFPQINLVLEDYSFPTSIINEEIFSSFVCNNQYQRLKNAIKSIKYSSNYDTAIVIINPWYDYITNYSEKFDYIFSRAVMEHVKDPLSVYKNLTALLLSGGIMFHDIEFHSHDISKKWRGHYHINNFLWKIIFGNRNYYLNRYTPSSHVLSIKENNLRIIDTYLNFDKNSLHLDSTSSNDIEDAKIYGASFLIKK